VALAQLVAGDRPPASPAFGEVKVTRGQVGSGQRLLGSSRVALAKSSSAGRAPLARRWEPSSSATTAALGQGVAAGAGRRAGTLVRRARFRGVENSGRLESGIARRASQITRGGRSEREGIGLLDFGIDVGPVEGPELVAAIR